MVYKRQEGDAVLARFFIHGNSDEAIRFIKRRNKFYQVNDIHKYKLKRGAFNESVEHTHIDTIVEIEPLEIIRLINAALNATLNWKDQNEEAYEIWVNHYIYQMIKDELKTSKELVAGRFCTGD